MVLSIGLGMNEKYILRAVFELMYGLSLYSLAGRLKDINYMNVHVEYWPMAA